ncbi:MAG: hypothetical protein J6V72_08695 [Kiritimatiellae bacterium]|nr:hypothetical protein [Kiritimatiellia bacterium]
MKSEKTTMRKRQLAACLFALSCAFAASATNWYVSPDGTGGGTSPTDRGEAISTSLKMGAGDTVYFAPGTYNLDKNQSASPNYGSGAYFRVSVNNATFIGESDNPEDVRLVGTGETDGMRIFYFSTQGHVLRNLLVSGGYTSYQGAGLCMADNFVSTHEQAFFVSNCVVENCSAAYQGASRGGVWRDCVIRNNTVRNTTVTPNGGPGPNQVEGSGGGVFHATLYNCVITNNVAGLCGGGIAGGRVNGVYNRQVCTTKAYNCVIGWNRAQLGAGAGVTCLYGYGTGVVTTLTERAYCQLFNCTVISNTASFVGGGTFLCTVSNSTIRGNSSTWSATSSAAENNHAFYRWGGGGGVMLSDVEDSLIEANASPRGGAGAVKSNLTKCRILNNVASGNPNGYGGGTYACPLVKDCVLAGNRANYGGAAFNGCLENCVITNNASTGVDGGATYNATSRNCIVVGNTAHRYYAHCRGAHYGDLVYGNKSENKNWDGVSLSAVASGIGADKENVNEGLPVVNCTVWNNLGGAAQVSRASLTNSVVMSVMAMDAHSAVNSFWRSGTVANQTGCISGTDKDPKFVGIDVTQTATESAKDAPCAAYAIRLGSPCRDKGMALPGQATETDALGNPRVKYGGVDMGALECIQSLSTYFLVR